MFGVLTELRRYAADVPPTGRPSRSLSLDEMLTSAISEKTRVKTRLMGVQGDVFDMRT